MAWHNNSLLDYMVTMSHFQALKPLPIVRKNGHNQCSKENLGAEQGMTRDGVERLSGLLDY